MRKLVWLNGVVFLALAIHAATGCGEPFTTEGAGGGTGGTGGMPTTVTTGGTGGMPTTSSTGGGGTGGTGGGACTPGDLSSCGAGEYCDKGTGKCVSCSDLTNLRFHTPQPLGVQVPNGEPALFPRDDKDGNLYFSAYVSLAMSPDMDIFRAPVVDPRKLKWGMAAALPAPLNIGAFADVAPLYLENGNGLGDVGNVVNASQPVILFHSDRSGGGVTKIYACNPGTTPACGQANLPVSGTLMMQVAAAPDAAPHRIWFMSNHAGAPDLYTMDTEAVGPTVDLVALPQASSCNFSPPPDGFAPWVTPDGKWLLFHSIDPDGNCNLTGSGVHDLYYLKLQSDKGQAASMETAKPLFPGNMNNYKTPSLSNDMCAVYFIREDNAMPFNSTTLMGAVRE